MLEQPRRPPAMAVAVARCGRIDRRMAALVSERAAVRTRPHLSQQAFRCVHPRLHRQLQLREPHVGGSCSECADRLVLLHEQHVTGSWTHTSAVAQKHPVTGGGAVRMCTSSLVMSTGAVNTAYSASFIGSMVNRMV